MFLRAETKLDDLTKRFEIKIGFVGTVFSDSSVFVSRLVRMRSLWAIAHSELRAGNKPEGLFLMGLIKVTLENHYLCEGKKMSCDLVLC